MNKRDKIFMTFGAVALIAAGGIGGYIIFKPSATSASPTIATSRQSRRMIHLVTMSPLCMSVILKA